MFQLPPVYFERLLESLLDIVIAVDVSGSRDAVADEALSSMGVLFQLSASEGGVLLDGTSTMS